jgi:hypothetical protein
VQYKVISYELDNWGGLIPGEGRIFLYATISMLAVNTRTTVQWVMGVLCSGAKFQSLSFYFMYV